MQWGRLQADVNLHLRRGAWYRVLQVASLETVIEVNRKPLSVPSYLLEIVSTPPRCWTVVPTPRSVPRGVGYLGKSYAVCPRCRDRVRLLPGKPRRMPCESCRTDFEVAWDEAYLENA